MTNLAIRFKTLHVVLAVMLSLVALGYPGNAAAQDTNLQMDGQKAVEAWVSAVVSGDVERVEKVLAPEFQIQRSDGTAYDKTTYLASDLPRFAHMPEISGLVVTAQGDLLVARYILSSGGVRAGVKRPRAPRLTVFRRSGDVWLVVAHANFAVLP